MRPMLRLLLPFLLTYTFANAQSGCPGCLITVPPGLPADTIYLPAFPDGQQGVPYNKDYSFRMPKTTTPVAAIDTTTPAGLPISKIEILGLSGLPQGLAWQPNAWTFDPNTQPDGCIKLCGIPLEADSFVLMVKIKVSVFFITQEAEFPLRLYIAPKVSITEGFSMTNFTGCGRTKTTFVNNIPSNNKPGFTYRWNFGDSTSFVGENPPPHLYNTPGTYPVSYQAIIDTTGFILQSATVLKVDCVDQVGIGTPDLYLLVKKPDGTLLFDSSPDINNTPLPYTFQLNLPIGAGNYVLETWDEDSGAKGGDDPCGNISFNILSNDTIISAGFKVVLNIIHPIDTIYAIDTVQVFEVPTAPFVSAPNGEVRCSNDQIQLRLLASNAPNYQWLLDGEELEGEIDSSLTPTISGYYQVAVKNDNACVATSDSLLITINNAPATPLYYNYNNLLSLEDTFSLPATYQLQWFNNAQPIDGATDVRYCATTDGTYGVQITDLATLCTAYYASTIDYDPNFDCTVTTINPSLQTLWIAPNPAKELVTIRLPEQVEQQAAQLSVWNELGQRIMSQSVTPQQTTIELATSQLQSGMYHLIFQTKDGVRAVAKLAILK